MYMYHKRVQYKCTSKVVYKWIYMYVPWACKEISKWIPWCTHWDAEDPKILMEAKIKLYTSSHVIDLPASAQHCDHFTNLYLPMEVGQEFQGNWNICWASNFLLHSKFDIKEQLIGQTTCVVYIYVCMGISRLHIHLALLSRLLPSCKRHTPESSLAAVYHLAQSWEQFPRKSEEAFWLCDHPEAWGTW